MISQTEKTLTYSEIYQSCQTTISHYLEQAEKKSADEITLQFLAASAVGESYQLHLKEKQFTFRRISTLDAKNLNQAQQQLMQQVSEFAMRHGLINEDTRANKENEEKQHLEESSQKRHFNSLDHPLLNPSKRASNALFPTLASKKMQKNLAKALKEHGKKEVDVPSLFKPRPFSPLVFHSSLAENRGDRNDMEDCAFYEEQKHGILAGVFDGHVDKEGEIATHAANYFQQHFWSNLEKSPDQIFSIFGNMMNAVHQEIVDLKQDGGTTALVCFINKQTNILYTATLGDSEGYIFRKEKNTIVAYPVSCVRNWSSPKDAQRAVEGLKAYSFSKDKDFFYPLIDFPLWINIKNWTETQRPKSLRFPPHKAGINVSRALGDYHNLKQWPPLEILGHKPKITEFYLNEDDLLLMGSDGAWDFFPVEVLIEQVLLPQWEKPNIAQLLVDYILSDSEDRKKRRRDNATVLSIRMQTKKTPSQ